MDASQAEVTVVRLGKDILKASSIDVLLFASTGGGLAAGGLLRLTGLTGAAHGVWAAIASIGLAAALWWVVDSARQGRFGVDLIAVLALVGTLAVGEYLAGAVIAFMLATGRSLESWAAGRASRELEKLVQRAPKSAHVRDGSVLVDVAVSSVKVGDLVVVKPGELVPVDGMVETGPAVIDESALTGEPLPVERGPGDPVRSGTVNVGGPIELRSTSTSETSTYAGIVELVRAAETATAPAVRLADRYALWFVAVALVASTGAALAAGSLARAVAVLVVATPCPLILAVPVALVSGLSVSARRGVVIKGGAVLERLARSRVLLFDKTGTLTLGHPELMEIAVPPGEADGNRILRLAASVDQVSPHVLAAALVRAAHTHAVALEMPTDVQEVPGQGVRGRLDGHVVTVGKAAWAGTDDTGWSRAVRRKADREGRLTVFAGVDGRLSGVFLLADAIRTDAVRTIRRLRSDGIERIVMVTGDRDDVASSVGAVIGVDEVLSERTPAEKLDAVTLARTHGPTVMVGDGINDAPALALADVGVAIGARGATASSEAADAVLAVDRLDRIGDAIVIARRSLRIATQSVVAGIGLSLVAMAVAGFGFLPAVWGAVTQEAIDVAVIINAMRALRSATGYPSLESHQSALAGRFSAEHLTLRPRLEQIKRAADAIGMVPDGQALALAEEVSRWLTDELLPHERAEDEELYPMMADVLGGSDRTSTMSRAHAQIAHQIRRLDRLIADIGDPPEPEDLPELRGLLYGLYAVLELHFTQEDESYLSLDGDGPPRDAERPPGQVVAAGEAR
ncbi:MAG TPA: heavy metal translocating P-type ATPase [Acidimicrobiales bacterium]|nr:heavy metal translocating P-type ATPase [Acidimicrobiales bacterium]